MRFSPDRDFGAYTIRSYQAGEVIVVPPAPADATTEPPSQLTLTRSFVISREKLTQDWAPQALAQLTIGHLQEIIGREPELVILGTGKTLDFPGPQITLALHAKGIGVEFMDSAAACRTYNVLMHEGRDVIAAVILD